MLLSNGSRIRKNTENISFLKNRGIHIFINLFMYLLECTYIFKYVYLCVLFGIFLPVIDLLTVNLNHQRNLITLNESESDFFHYC
jgi:hypothetical protein